MKAVRHIVLLCIAGIVSLTGALPAIAAELQPSWTCLPEETVAVVRIPGGNAAAEALKTRTRLGTLLFSSDRVQRLGELLGKDGREEWEEFTQELAKYDLKVRDLGELFHGEAGFAVAMLPREGKLPRAIAMGWLEPGGDLTTRMLAALEKSMKENPAHNSRRTDIELAGHKVIHLAQSVTVIRAADSPKELRKLSPEERKALREGRDDPNRTYVGTRHYLLARLGDRLILAANLIVPDDEMQERSDEITPPDEAADPGLEALQGMTARFLEAHAEGGSGGTFSVLQAPGVSAALPAGLPVIEVLADLRPIVKLSETVADPKLHRILKGLGTDQLGPLAYRMTLDANLLRGGFFLSSPEPRSGILALADQPPLAAQPPAWVPADVVSYAHVRFDVAQAFEQIKKPLLEEMGEQVQPLLSLVELQLKNVVQTDLKTLLSSLGSEHVLLSFPPQEIDEADLEKAKSAADRSAFVWPVKDEALWKRILETVAGASGKEVIEEQGFKGIRFDERTEGGAFVGHGYLVVGIGAGVTENVLSTLRNPPRGEASLLSSPLLSRANELLPPVDGLAYYLTDMNRYAKTTRRTLSSMLNLTLKTHEEGVDEDGDLMSMLQTLQKLLPSEDELEGVLGVEVGQVTATAQGIVSRSVIELPASGR